MQCVASSFRSVAGSALAAGCVSWSVRQSSRSFSGSVVVPVFGSAAAAATFATRWSARCGVPVVVRGLSVSVPCVWVPPAPRLSARAERLAEKRAAVGLA